MGFLVHFFLIFLSLSVKLTKEQCLDKLLENVDSAGSCGSPYVLDNSKPNFPSALATGVKTIGFDALLTLKSICSNQATSRLFMITITPTFELPVLDIYYDTSAFQGYARGPSSSLQVLYISRTLAVGVVMEFVMSLNLLSGSVSSASYANGITSSTTTTAPYDSTWTFDGTTKFYICSETNGMTPFICNIQSFTLWFTYASDMRKYRGGIYPTLIGSYQMAEKNTQILKDSVGTIGNGTLDLTSDQLSNYFDAAEPGICFQTTTQKATLPAFSMAGDFEGSMTISFWIKLTTPAPGVLFSWVKSGGSTPVLATIQNNRKVKVTLNDPALVLTGNTQLALDTWSMITINIGLGGVAYLSTATVYFSSFLDKQETQSGIQLYLNPSDKIVIGPFSGKTYITNYRIYSPGSTLVTPYATCLSSTIPTTCSTIIGAPSSNQCLSPVCDVTCSTCVDSSPRGCLTCPNGRSMTGSSCSTACYQYPQGGCQATCDAPYVINNTPSTSYCDYPCASGQFFYYNESCITGCSPPFSPIIYGTMLYCDFPCSANQFLYPDGICRSDCLSPMRTYEEITDKFFCLGPCTGDWLYYPDLNTCLVSCSVTYIMSSTSYYSTCIPQTTTPTNSSNPTNPTTPSIPTNPTTSTSSEKTPVQVVASTTKTASQAVTQVTSALTSGGSIGVSAMIAGKIFSNIKFLKLNNSEELEEALTSWTTDFLSVGMSPGIPDFVSNSLVNESVPYVFGRHGVSSSFLWNFWDETGLLIIVTGICLSLLLLEWIVLVGLKQKRLKIFSSIRTMGFNFLLTQLYNLLGDAVLFGMLELRSIHFRNGYTILSFALTMLFLAIVLICLVFHLRLVFSYSKTKASSLLKLTEWKRKYENVTVLFEDFKDISKLHQSFLLFLTIRDILFSFILTTLFEHPLLQSTLILGLNIGILIYLYAKYPFNSLLEGIQQWAFELIAFAVNICVIITAGMDSVQAEGEETRKRLGKFVIIMNLLFNFGTGLFMVTKLFLLALETYRSYKSKKLKQQKIFEIPKGQKNIQSSKVKIRDSSTLRTNSQTPQFSRSQNNSHKQSFDSLNISNNMSFENSQTAFIDVQLGNVDSWNRNRNTRFLNQREVSRKKIINRSQIQPLPRHQNHSLNQIGTYSNGETVQPYFLRYEQNQMSSVENIAQEEKLEKMRQRFRKRLNDARSPDWK